MKKTFTKIIALLIVSIMIMGSAPLEMLSDLDFYLPKLNIFSILASASESGSAGTNATWSIDDDGIFTISGSGAVTNVVWDDIKDSIIGIVIEDGITSIPPNAFSYCVNLKSVRIPNTVTNIGAYAFATCSALESITIPGSITGMGSYVFNGCGLKSIIITDGATVLGNYAFQNCTELTEAVIPNSVVSNGMYAFKGCTSLERITMSSGWSVIPKGICFGCSALEEVIIPEGCTAFADDVFFNCSNLKRMIVPESVTDFGNTSFTTFPYLVIECERYTNEGTSYAYNYCLENEVFYACDVDTEAYTAIDYTVYNDHTYELFSNEVTWPEARAICEAKGGHMVTITSPGEETEIANLASDNSLSFWLGATDKATEGTWIWITGEPWNYTVWGSSQPDNSTNRYANGEDYVSFDYTTLTWYDIPYAGTRGFVCEYDDVRIPKDTSKKTLANNGATTYARFDFAVSWQEAKKACEEMGGHLATVTTAAEESVISSLCSGGSMAGYWLGGTDEGNEGAWRWITDEEWNYTAWGPTQPDNSGGYENFLEYLMSSSAWNDGNFNLNIHRGFICEFDATYIPVKSVIYNNHLYSLYNESLSWTDAEAVCVGAGGHLASITDDEEQSVINDLLSGQFKGLYWIGAHHVNDSWTWSSNEAFSFSNWGPGEPSETGEDGGNEEYAQTYSHAYSTKVLGEWNDSYNTGTASGYYQLNNIGFICEIDLGQYTAYKGEVYNNNYYEVYSQSAYWTDAKEFAESRGGHLATIADENENAAIASLLCEETRRGCWIGGSNYEDGTWKWVDGSSFNYTNWSAEEPNNTDFKEFFIEYYLDGDGHWNDLRNNRESIGFVVEYENAVGTQDGISWSYDGMTLTLSGSGDLTHINELINASWFSHIRGIQLEGEFDSVITSLKNTEWYMNLSNGPVVVDGCLLDYKGTMPVNTELLFDNVTEVASDALKDQTNLKTVMFGEALEKVFGNAFSGCTGLQTVELSENVSSIADNAFAGCVGVTVTGFYNEYVETFARRMSFDYSPYTVTLTLNPTDGFIESDTFLVVAKKALSEVVIPEADDDEYAFGGWYLDAQLAEPVTSETVFYEDAVIYASWLEVASVAIKTMPDTLQYVIGDSIDTTGLVLTATYPNGTTKDFDSGFSCSPERFTKQGKYRIKVDFKDKYAYFYVEVKATENMTLSVASLPNKLSYETGDQFDPTGMTLLLDYGNGITKTIKKGFNFDYDFSSAGTKTVTVSFAAGETVLLTGINVEVTEADYVVYSDDIVCNADTFEVPVKIKGNQGVMEISLDFSYDSELIRPVSIVSNDGMDGTIIDSIGENSGAFNVYWSGNEAFFDNGTMFTLTFESLVNRKCETEIEISYDATETCDEDWSDITLICRPIGIRIAVPEAPLFYSESFSITAGDPFELPIFVSNPLNLTEATFSLVYDKNAFSLESVSSSYGTTVVTNDQVLQVTWNGSIEEDGILILIRFASENTAVGQYDFYLSCNNAVFEDTGVVICREFAISVENETAATIFAEATDLKPGEDIDVYLSINHNPGIMGFSLVIDYDPDILTIRNIRKCEMISGGLFDYSAVDGSLKLVWNSTSDITENGRLFCLSFATSESSDYDSTELHISFAPEDTFNANWDPVVFDCESVDLQKRVPQAFLICWHINDIVYRTIHKEGTAIEIPDITPDHYTIAGWTPEVPTIMPAEDVHLYAILVANVYQATFYINGVAVSKQEYTVDTASLNEPEIPPKPYYFARWQGYSLKTGGDLSIYPVYDPPKVISAAQKTMHVGDRWQLITSSNFDATRTEWSTSDPLVASVDNHGNVTAVGIGSCTISVTRYGEDAFGNEVRATSNTSVKVTKPKVQYDSAKDWLRDMIERFFTEIMRDVLENLKRMGWIIYSTR